MGDFDPESKVWGSRGGGGDVSKSDVMEEKDVAVGSFRGTGPESIDAPTTDPVFEFPGRSSSTVDCLFRLSSSSSSAISINRRRRKELVDELVEPEAVCKEQAAERVVSRSSLAVVIGKSVS